MVIDFDKNNKLWHCEIDFQSYCSKGTIWTLYSAHQSNKLHRNVKLDNLSWRAHQFFKLSKANSGQKLVKLRKRREGSAKFNGQDRPLWLIC